MFLNRTNSLCPLHLPIPLLPSGRALIVGATGQLGAQLVSQLGAAALPGARRPQSAPDWLHLDLESIAANPAQLDDLIARHNITAVYCSAGATDVERCESDHAWASAANHLGPLALARASRDIPFVFFSTDYVFDGSPENPGPYTEDAVTNPLSVYGRTKLEGEQSILAAHPSALVLRTTTVYGPDPQGKNYLYTLSRVLKAGNIMKAPTDQLATPTYNADLAAAAIALVARKHTGIFHAAGPDFLSRYNFAIAACKILAAPHRHAPAHHTPELAQKAARPLLAGLVIGKLQTILGPTCMRSVETGIRDWQASSPEPTA